MYYLEIIKKIKESNDSVILFHSATGKDSIMLCDLLSKSFKRVICVFMYIVKNLQYENNYIEWATLKYANIEFIQVPHYAVYSFLRAGYLGIKKDESICKMKISKIDELIRKQTCINFSIYGFKKNDGLTRRLMLNNLIDGINHKTNKGYPLMDLKNSEVLDYIKDNDLIKPFCYDLKKPSSGCDISQPKFLQYLKNKYPKDLQKVFEQYPMTEAALFNYENNK